MQLNNLPRKVHVVAQRNAESNKNSFSVIRFKQKIKTSNYSIDLCRGDILSCINPYSFSFNSFCNIAKDCVNRVSA